MLVEVGAIDRTEKWGERTLEGEHIQLRKMKFFLEEEVF